MHCYALSFFEALVAAHSIDTAVNILLTLTTFKLCLAASLKHSAIEVIFIPRIEHQPYEVFLCRAKW